MPTASHPLLSGLKVGTVPITSENKNMIVSDYVARTSAELPVLARWIPRTSLPSIPDAMYLDLILYHYDQIVKESEAMNKPPPANKYDWAIISIKAQLVNHELPMDPITMMRNALGKQEGGSGVPLQQEKYLQSVDFWKNHVNLM